MERVRESVLKSLKESKEKRPYSTVFVYNNVQYNAENIIKEIENNTELGKFFLEKVVATATDMVLRGKA